MNLILSQSSWEILGVAPDADVVAIKRAYAAKLKIFRPDEDPVGFQRLREARDAAIRLSEFRARDVAEETPDWELDDDTVVDEAEAAPEIVRGNEPDISGEDEVVVVVPLPTFRSEAEPGEEASERSDREDEPAAPGAKTSSAPHPDSPAIVPRPPVVLPPPAPNPPSVVREPVPTAPPSPPPNHLALAALAVRFQSGADVWDWAAWRQILRWIAESNFADRASLERTIVSSFGELMGKSGWEPARALSWRQRWLQPTKSRIALAEAGDLRRARARVLRLIDEEFGWSRDDRMLYASLGPALADRLADHVREARAADPAVPRASVFPPRRRPSGFPLLEERDLIAFLGKRNASYLNFYQSARQASAYPMDWSSVGFVFPFAMQMRARHWLLGSGFFAADMLTGSVVVWLATNGRLAPAIAVMLAQGGAHLLAGLKAKRWLIEAAARAIEEADERALVFAAERTRFLQRIGKLPAVAIIASVLFTCMMDVELIAVRDGDQLMAPSNPPSSGTRP